MQHGFPAREAWATPLSVGDMPKLNSQWPKHWGDLLRRQSPEEPSPALLLPLALWVDPPATDAFVDFLGVSVCEKADRESRADQGPAPASAPFLKPPFSDDRDRHDSHARPSRCDARETRACDSNHPTECLYRGRKVDCSEGRN